jgi:hypothetical protein
MIKRADDAELLEPWEADRPERALASRAGRAAAIAKAGRPGLARASVLTAEHDYTAEELAFLAAIEAYKRRSGRPFPSWTEVLAVLKSLGYARAPVPEPALNPAAAADVPRVPPDRHAHDRHTPDRLSQMRRKAGGLGGRVPPEEAR